MDKYYLKDGDEVTADFAEVKFINGVMCFDGWGECDYFFRGKKVQYDKKFKPYIDLIPDGEN